MRLSRTISFAANGWRSKGTQPKKVFGKYETDQLSALVLKIDNMLGSADTFTEAQWQTEILQVIQFLCPKYVSAFPEVPVRDALTGKDRQIDFLLVDASGYVDAIEIKKPFAECVVTSNRYRMNMLLHGAGKFRTQDLE